MLFLSNINFQLQQEVNIIISYLIQTKGITPIIL
jgi:hypothetical protein